MRTCIGFVVLVLVILVSPVIAQEKEKETDWKPSGVFTLTYQENHYKRAFNAVFNEDPVVIGDFVLNLPKGFYVETWGSFGTDDWAFNTNKGDEFDFFAGWKGKIEDFDVKFYVSYVDFQPLEMSRGDLIVTSLAVSRNFELGKWEGSHSLRPEFRVDYVAASDLEEGAWVYLPSLTHTWKEPFGINKVSLWQQLTLQHSEDFRIFNDRTSLQWNGGVTWKISKHISLNAPTLFISTPLSNSHDNHKEFHTLGASLMFSF